MKRKIFTFCFGGAVYALLEILWNGKTHWTMFLLGGFCFRIIGKIRNIKTCLINQCLLSSAAITLSEFLFGVLLNSVLKFKIWDYSHLPFNFRGQICLPFSLLWILISLPAIKIHKALEKIKLT